MTELIESIRKAIDDARALLDALNANGWADLHIDSGETEVFIARPGGRSNPMAVQPEPTAVCGQPAITSTYDITAPHVATIVELAAAGARIEAGEHVVVLSVLDEPFAVSAPTAGWIKDHCVPIGSLVEFGSPVLRIVEHAPD